MRKLERPVEQTLWRQKHAGEEPAKSAGGFTMIELLIVITIIILLALLALPALAHAKGKVRSLACLNNLKQWGAALHMYAAEHDDYLPDEGSPTPGRGVLRVGWYVTLPRMLGVAPYHEMPWRSNAELQLPRSVFLCPGNVRRATNHNLFHYCLNGHVDGTGDYDRPRKISTLPAPALTVYLFDNGRRAAVAQQNNVHTNLHGRGAQFLFVDGHTAWFKNTVYWNFEANKGRVDFPELVWRP